MRKLFPLLFLLSLFVGKNVTAQDFKITSELRINAKIDTVEAGLVNAIWSRGGSDTTARGDSVIWGYFYASDYDVSWGNEGNPEVFVKIWFDASGRIDVNFFHVSVPNIQVFSSKNDNDQLMGTTSLNERYVRHNFYTDGTQESVTERTGETVKRGKYKFISNDSIPTPGLEGTIYTDEAGPIMAYWIDSGAALTTRGDLVIWGYIFAEPDYVDWGSVDNPEVFIKIWLDQPTSRYDVNFFHVSVPDIDVLSAIVYVNAENEFIGKHDEESFRTSKATLRNRYVRHEYELE